MICVSAAFHQDPDFERSGFLQTCAYCGARFEVLVSRDRGGEDEVVQYPCPDCGKTYKTHAALTPVVNLVARRTDGKGDNYQETMF
jgi:hypothetical protein